MSIGGITLPFDEKELADLWQLLLGSMTGGSDALTALCEKEAAKCSS